MTDPLKRTRLYQYKAGSQGAKALAERGILRIKREGSTFNPRRSNYTVINWGSSNVPNRLLQNVHVQIVNHPDAVSTAGDKLKTFQTIAEYNRSNAGRRLPVSIPPFTTNKETVAGWKRDGKNVFARTILNGAQGGGIVYIKHSDTDPIPDAPLYTMYLKSDEEYRVHFSVGTGPFLIQKKVHRPGDPAPQTWKIRNHANGFIFQTVEKEEVPEHVLEQARRAFVALKLDFCAFDIITKQNEAYILEANTAPGIEDETADKYIQMFIQLLGE